MLDSVLVRREAASHPKRTRSTATALWELQNSQIYLNNR